MVAIILPFGVEAFAPVPRLLDDLVITPISRLLQLLIPVGLMAAILQRRLWDIDYIINRTLVYSVLSLLITAVYVLIIGGIGSRFQSQNNLLLSILTTVLVALLFQRVRDWLQQSVNRLMFGERDDPYTVLSLLGDRLQHTATPADALNSVVETVAGTLKLPYVAVELFYERGRLGGAAVAAPIRLPLHHQNETVGQLLVSPRSPGEALTERERRLLTDIAAQTGATASAVRLTAALQRAREKLVLAREEERRRIRRDLHDELGPTLASQTFALDAVLELMEEDPLTARALVRKIKTQNQATVSDIRRLVYQLRPPALDELGLVGALRAHLRQLDAAAPRIRFVVEPDPLPALPAAVDVAAYRIVLEAVTNVIRHAGARQCTVRLQLGGEPAHWLRIAVDDDGRDHADHARR